MELSLLLAAWSRGKLLLLVVALNYLEYLSMEMKPDLPELFKK